MNPKLVLAAMIAVAVGLRWADIGQLSLAHFDEGVLVSGAFGVWLNGLWHFPLSQPLQAPPLLPWMVAGAFGITQTPWPIMGIYVSATVSVATVVIYFYWLRRLYNDWLALAGAGFLAASDLHVAFSRMALTDVTLTFFFVLGGYLLSRMATTASQPPAGGRVTQVGRLAAWAIGMGLATGAAWNTKYNGWMLLAMAATTWLIVALRGWLLDRGDTDRESSFGGPAMIVALFVAALVAVGCFAPWYRYVEQAYPGGYAAITRNHLRYVGGLDDWPPRAARLWTSLSAFRHYGWLITLLASAVAGVYFARRVPPAHRRRGPQARSGMAVLAVLCGLGAIAVSGGDATL
ncbi:MAG TPA: phospholipid carrier-dependent glycosyltransferase, partial [Pirellulales bacterium]|nr:phospholipid carrier-dependent glycosyltransferase [Pirellulales bacterium]